ncbi:MULTISPECIES: 2-succinylbenzoate--CoA ligase [unclassified Coleofasciculus]|uniref:2-succinylbenzoate--CoA ligase n=1 Tax=unclassified Coleofasciculus TaxID=2692782 RepID=UPI00188009E8|nr:MULTISPECIES: 2-succinylbenzoate--CoA ligase [unclassified Coleofasciculus]MBE9128662.1 2-succinylbenzoate--CoA ligase [Coleofasciculus sp. LEGE 07081]MBE9149743.1 2-succinylbenzoate--CoA ligase [Coleofasciculus sp. LEGE 07092]
MNLTYLKHRADEDWLIGYDTNQFHHLTEQLFQEFTQLSQGGTSPTILLAEPNPWRFLAAFLAAVAADCPVFLGNPNWVEQEWQQVFELVQPDLIWGDLSSVICHLSFVKNKGQRTTDNEQIIMIPTGGSSGNIRFAVHSWQTLMASARGFYQYFDQKPVNSFCVLPLYHVSGLMQFLRSLTTGGKLVILPFKDLVTGKGQDINPSEFFISLVPTQLQRLLSTVAAEWLSQFQTVLLGGAPAWESLLADARHHRIRLALTYGMTETASQVVTLKPEDFLAGNNSCGQILPHAQVSVRSATGELLGTNQTGIITIQADSLALGYYRAGEYPNLNSKLQTLESDDLGFFDDRGYLTIIGRRSHKIITGGENVFPAEVEAAILATQQVVDIAVIGLPDRYWGEAITAIYVPPSPEVSVDLLQRAVAEKLSKFKCPKYWVKVECLPRNAQGKVNYEELKNIALADLEMRKGA